MNKSTGMSQVKVPCSKGTNTVVRLGLNSPPLGYKSDKITTQACAAVLSKASPFDNTPNIVYEGFDQTKVG